MAEFTISHFILIIDGHILPISRRQKAYNNGTLVIEQLQRSDDAGTYTCGKDSFLYCVRNLCKMNYRVDNTNF